MTAKSSRRAANRGGPMWLERLLRVGLATAALFLLAGVTYQAMAVWNDSRAFPPVGRLIDVAGRTMHLNCTGAGAVTVVLESGLGGTWMDWALVQPDVAAFARVCSYDRAGMGWSEPGAQPRDSASIAAELESLLRAAGERTPYLLVGHSVGGYHVRVFVGRYPDLVSGVLLVDSAHPEMFERLPPDATGELDSLAVQFRELHLQMFVGLPRLRGHCGQAAPGLEQFAGEHVFNQCRTSFMGALRQELSAARTDATQAAAVKSLGAIPLIVVSRDFSVPEAGLAPDTARKAQIEGRKMHEELAALSTVGRVVKAAKSGHFVQLDRPDVIIQAIRNLVGAVRTHHGRTGNEGI